MQLKTSLQSTRKEILNRFSKLGRLKTWLHSTMKEILTWFFTWSWRQLETWLNSNMKGIFTWFSPLRSLKKKNSCRALWRKFWHEFPLYGASNLDCRALWKRFWHDFQREGSSKLRCRALWNIILTWFSPSKRLKTWLQSTIWKKFRHDFPLYGGSEIGCRALWNRFWHDIPFKCSSQLGFGFSL